MRTIMSEIGSVVIGLPGTLLNARNLAFISKFTETNATEIEVTHKTLTASATETAIHLPCAELRLLL